jgi:hypothetical protein
MVKPPDGNLHRKYVGVKLAHEQWEGEELLSFQEMGLWWRGSCVVKGLERRRFKGHHQCTVHRVRGEGEGRAAAWDWSAWVTSLRA